MMAVRERAVAVMAALDRRVPSLDDFVGQSWSSWAERTHVFVSDAGSDPAECSKNGRTKMDTMTLQKEDMSVFGHCPAQDDFYLVVCSHCGQVVKPQAFQKHCERRHRTLGKLHARLHASPSAPLQRPRPPSAHGTSHGARDGRQQGAGPPRGLPQTPQTTPHHRHAKPQELTAGFTPSERVSQEASPNCNMKKPPPSDSPPAPSLRDPPWPHGATPPSTTPPAEKPVPRKGEPGRSPNLTPPLRGPRTYKKVSRKECDLDKHCGVLDPERKMLCTRLLTCNIHSIHQRRKVLGRSRNFDQLVAELKTGSKAGGECSGQSREGAEPCPPAPEPSGDKTGTPHCRREIGKSTAFRSRTSSESAPEEERVRPETQEEAPPLSPPTQSRLSSDDSDREGPEEPPEWHSAPAHPKPLALCSFGSHSMGRGVFTFDRRLHHLRSALSSVVEHHLNAHLWRKMPQATDAKSQRTSVRPSATATTDYNSQHSTASTARGAGNHCSSSFRTSSSNGAGKEVRPHNCSPSPGSGGGPSESTGGGRPIASSFLAHSPSPSGAGPPRNPVGRPSRQQQRLGQADQSGTASRKRRASPQEDAPPCPERASGTPVAPQGPGRPPPSPHGPINGSLSPGHKPRPQGEPRSPSPGLFKRAPPPPVRHSPDLASRGWEGDSGVQSKAVSYDHKGLGRKCRGSGPSPQKIHRLPSSSPSGFFSWKKDGVAGGLSTGLEKRLSTQKPKLHH